MNLATLTEIAAFVGAAAWLPQIASWMYRRYVAPRISLLPDKQVQIGYTCFGPLFNIRIAFSADEKDAIVNRFEVCLRHEDGDEHRLDWVAMTEHLSNIVDQVGNRQVVEREQAPIAFKVTTQTLLEKFVRFQEPKFLDAIKPSLEEWGTFIRFLDSKGGGHSDQILSSKQHSDLLVSLKQHFWWKKGRYTFSFRGCPR